jgi:hypothetical protein
MSADSHVDSDELDPDEPRTPLWLPLLGAALFLAVFTVFLVTRGDPEDTTDVAAVVEAGAANPDTGAAQPEAAQPEAAQPEAAQPRAVQPRAAQPGAAQPGVARPSPAEPGTGQPSAGQGQPDPHQRMPGDPHFGHDHP